MKVKRLIELLSTCRPDAEVIVSEDEEGNDYHNVIQVDVLNDKLIILWPDDVYLDPFGEEQ